MKASARISVPSFSGFVQHLQPALGAALPCTWGYGGGIGQVWCWGRCSSVSFPGSPAGAGCYTVVGKRWHKNGGKRKGDLSGVVTLIHFPTSWSLLKCHLLSWSFQTYLKLQLISQSLSMVCALLCFFYSSYHHLAYYVFILLPFSSHQIESSFSVGTFHIRNSVWYIHVLNVCGVNK